MAKLRLLLKFGNSLIIRPTYFNHHCSNRSVLCFACCINSFCDWIPPLRLWWKAIDIRQAPSAKWCNDTLVLYWTW